MGTKQCGGCHEENAQALDLDYGLRADAARTYAIIGSGGQEKGRVVIVADTRKLDGFLYWWAEMYNESHFFFAILTMIIIPILGCILGLLATSSCRASASTSNTANWLKSSPERRQIWIGCIF